MERKRIKNLDLWQFDSLAKHQTVRHFVSDRNSNEGGGEFTLSYSSLPDRAMIDSNRAILASAMEVDRRMLFMPSQVHLANIVRITPDTPHVDLRDTDALITNARNACIAVMSADCVPILLYDEHNHAAAAIHSGWKGTVAKILTKTLLRMKEEFGTKAGNVIACIGPSVCQTSYEVGDEVVTAFQEAFDGGSDLMVLKPQGKAMLDLWKANVMQLESFGVPEDRIEVANLCTVINNGNFFSARKGDSGRFAAGIVLA